MSDALGSDPRQWPPEWRERFEERAAILEFDAGFSRWEAELRAKQVCREQYEQQQKGSR